MNDLQPLNQNKSVGVIEWTPAQVALIKKTVAKGTTDDELKLFLYTCRKTGLDPLIRQIYAVKRGGVSNQMSIQTGIDGYRLIAERTGKYAPGREPTWQENNGKIISATAYVRKFVNGQWLEIAATAFYDEYKQERGPMWVKMPHLMIAKCAEALVLRKAFPAEMAGVYTQEEMQQADNTETGTALPHTAPMDDIEADEMAAVKAKAEAAKKSLAEAEEKAQAAAKQEFKANAPEKKENAPSEGLKIARGVVIWCSEVNKFGYQGFALEGCKTPDGARNMRFDSKDEGILEVLNRHYDDKTPVEITYEEKHNGKYVNYTISEVAQIDEVQAEDTESEPEEMDIP